MKLNPFLAAALLLAPAVPAVMAADRVSVDFFHENLESYGDWREVGDYGYCWQPRDVDRDWRPYGDGRWLYTDAGWTWDSEEPYSWAVYHYGRWARVQDVGWVWVPGTEWGPAWVSWRRSPQHVGWAPLPPEARFSRTEGFSARVDADFDIGPNNYNFVEARNFGAPRLRTVFVDPRDNVTILHQTTNITRITYVNNVVYNEGPQYDVISRESALPIRRLKLDRRSERDFDSRTARGEQFRAKVEGDSLRVREVPFDERPATVPRKLVSKVQKVEVDRGWRNAGQPAEVEKVRMKIKSDAATAETPRPRKDAKMVDAPTEAIPSDEAPGKGQNRKGEQRIPPARPVAEETAPISPVKPVANERLAPPVPPSVDDVRPLPPVAAKNVPPAQARKQKGRTPEAPDRAVDAPKEEIRDRSPKDERPRNVAPGRAEAEPEGRGVPEESAPPKARKQHPENRRPERERMQPPQPRPQAEQRELRRGPAPEARQPQPQQPMPGKGKGKGRKGEQKNQDELMPDDAAR